MGVLPRRGVNRVESRQRIATPRERQQALAQELGCVDHKKSTKPEILNTKQIRSSNVR